ncbi:MAG: winged helix-turn-helix transcriptional regulator [Euryarchaeota archaeon]|nr:winged helix-turn-helix transcriptional regulator [Euryarchaeota archaeon]
MSTWTEQRDGAARVRAVALTISEPRTAGWIAEEADVSRNTARKHLDRLVETNELERVESGGTVLYRPDELTRYFRQLRDLIENHDTDELAEGITAIKADIREWRSKYDVDSPDELRATIASADLDPKAERERREVANDWEHARHRIELVRDAIELYDRFTGERFPVLA